MISEIYSNQADPARSHVNRQTQCDVRRILRVMKYVWIRELYPALLPQREPDNVLFREAEIELSENELRLRVLHITKAIARKLFSRIDHDEIIGLKLSTDVVYSDRDEALGML